MRHRKRGFLSKRAVSPLIATVLLISFAVALGSVVLNWGRNLDVSTGEDACSEAILKLEELSGKDACYKVDGNMAYLNFALKNEGENQIHGLGVWIVGEKGTKLLDFDSLAIGPKGSLRITDNTVSYSTETYGSIKHVQFIPKVKAEGSLDICPGSSVKAENVGFC